MVTGFCLRRDFLSLWLLTGLCLLAPVPGRAEEKNGVEDALFQMPMEELLRLKVFTASREEQDTAKATSVVSVITAEDIAASGARTLQDVLKRVPGFFPTRQATWFVVASRGLISDGNDQILLLVDGHSQNSVIGQGFQQQDMIPVLEKVKKIEIIRGPGSVLWGSSAVLGVINIITKDEVDRGDQATTSYGAEDGMFSANYMHSFSAGESVKGMVSSSFWRSRGYSRDGISGAGRFTSDGGAPDPAVKGNVEFPWGIAGDWPPADRQDEGYEIYSKVAAGPDNRLTARLVKTSVVYPWDTFQGNVGSALTMRRASLSFERSSELGDRVRMDSRIFGDLLLQNRFPDARAIFRSTTTTAPNADHMQDISNEEQSLGLDVMATWKPTDDHNLKLGVTGVRTIIGPNRDARFNVVNNTPALTVYNADGSTTTLNYLGVESGHDDDIALYAEDIYTFNEQRTTAFAGARYDHNDFREKKGVFLPRGGIIHSLTPELTVKYVLNTGYLRPAAAYSKTSGVIVDPTRGPSQGILVVNKSEKVLSHDLQVYWRKNRAWAALTGYFMRINNYMSFDAIHTPQGYKNLGNANTRGVEAEGGIPWGERWSLYANYSFSFATLDEAAQQGAIANGSGQTLNYPHHLFNLGAVWTPSRCQSVNVHLNGWRDMNVMLPWARGDFEFQEGRLKGEMYLDANYDNSSLFDGRLTLSVFVTNILDNQHAVGMAVNNGFWFPRGRDVGGKVAWRW
jgi:outer membrane receptor protein involved in Fe transport